jgi:hypothetical protein
MKPSVYTVRFFGKYPLCDVQIRDYMGEDTTVQESDKFRNQIFSRNSPVKNLEYQSQNDTESRN